MSESNDGLARAEGVHKNYELNRAAVETLFAIASILELAAFGLSALLSGGAQDPAAATQSTPPVWVPPVMMCLALVSWFVRAHAASVNQKGQDCRRKSMRSYAFAQDIDPATYASLGKPPILVPQLSAFAYWWRKLYNRLPAFLGFKKLDTAPLSLADYYGSNQLPGYGTLRYFCAYSALFTSRLLVRVHQYNVLAAIVSLLVGIVTLYWAATSGAGSTGSFPILRLVCVTIIGVVFVRFLDAAYSTHQSARSFEEIRKQLLDTTSVPTDGDLRDFVERLVDDYDFERAVSPRIPFLVYARSKTSLEKEWEELLEPLQAARQAPPVVSAEMPEG